MDFEPHSSLEKQLLDLIELATQMARGRDEAIERAEQLEERCRSTARDAEKLKRERLEEKEVLLQKERRVHDEKTQFGMETERLRTLNEELMAKCEFLKTQNEHFQAAIVEQQHSPSPAGHPAPSSQQQRLSHLVTKEVIDQVSEVHEMLKSLENRASIVCTNTTDAETRITEMSKLAERSREVLRQSQMELEATKRAYCEMAAKSRADTVKISALNLDVEGLQENVNRLREEVANLNQHRRSLESELERTKLAVATSIMPLLEKEKSGMFSQTTIQAAPTVSPLPLVSSTAMNAWVAESAAPTTAVLSASDTKVLVLAPVDSSVEPDAQLRSKTSLPVPETAAHEQRESVVQTGKISTSEPESSSPLVTADGGLKLPILPSGDKLDVTTITVAAQVIQVT